MKKRTLLVPLESLLYLEDQCHLQRGGHHTTEKTIERLTREMEKPHNKNGYMLFDGSFGGAVGDPKNSYEEGRWTSWSIDTVKEMLDKQGLPYQDGEDIDVINVNIF